METDFTDVLLADAVAGDADPLVGQMPDARALRRRAAAQQRELLGE